MVDPSNITDYNLTVPELEERMLFWICAAGKNGTTSARLLDKFLKRIEGEDEPFEAIKLWCFLVQSIPGYSHLPLAVVLKECGIGCYNHKARTIHDLAWSNLDLRTCTAEELEQIYGIGMKTSRCFLIHSRKGAQYAGIDTHMLKFLKARGHDVPKSTPTRKKYLELEKIFLEIAKKEKKLPADLDLEIWNAYSIK